MSTSVSTPAASPTAPSTNGTPQTNPEMVTLTIDGKTVSVPKGTNLIAAAASVGIEIPHYCYHPHLSVAGNCRMCQVRVKGMPKMEIGCNAQVKEGMEVSTHHTSKEVADTQAATLEFILLNHPLDCTVCDQAGHCKLQDYHYEYNAKPSRFLEEKEHKSKAIPLGPTVMLDGERCIMCTRCIRFCDEVTKTSELGMLNRGDHSVIAVNPGRELNNPLSGSVVDLCPVGALTHRHWRFNTRIWFTKQTDTICPGCSTGCNVKVAVRDAQVVGVKARLNSQVNKEWLCDEGRYGFQKLLPAKRVLTPRIAGKEATLEQAISKAREALKGTALVLVAPDLHLECFAALRALRAKFPEVKVVLAHRSRSLSSVEAVLLSPDRGANWKGAEWSGALSVPPSQEAYEAALQDVCAGKVRQLLLIGERSVLEEDQSPAVSTAIAAIPSSVGLLCDEENSLSASVTTLVPGRSVVEVSGLLLTSKKRLQYASAVAEAPLGSLSHWRFVSALFGAGVQGSGAPKSDREATLEMLKSDARLAGITIPKLKDRGVPID